MKVYTITSHVADQVAALEASSLRRRYMLKPVLVALLLLTLALMLYFFATNQPQGTLTVGGVGLVTLLLLGVVAVAGPSERDVAIKRAGAAGEATLPRVLESLPDTYTLLNGVPVPGSRADIDHVLVGPTGIWAIEAKHHVGSVQCVGDAWGYSRLGRGGVPHEGHIGNPSQQARRAAGSLERYLEHRHIQQQVYPVVIFTHPRVDLTVEQPTVAIVRADEALRLVLHQPQRMSAAAVQQTVETLRKLRPIDNMQRKR